MSANYWIFGRFVLIDAVRAAWRIDNLLKSTYPMSYRYMMGQVNGKQNQ